MGALISYINLADGATITNSSDGTEVTAETKVQTRQVGDAFIQTLAAGEDIVLDFDLGTAQNISFIAAIGHNITSGTWAVALGTSSGASDVATDSGTLWQGVADDPKNQLIILSQTYSARYVRLTLTNTPGGDTELGRVWIDDPWTPKVGVNYEHTVEDPSEIARSLGQSVYATERKRLRCNRIHLPQMDEEDAFGNNSGTAKNAHDMDITVGTHASVVVIPETAGADTTQLIHKTGVYGVIKRSTPIMVRPARPTTSEWLYEKRFEVLEER